MSLETREVSDIPLWLLENLKSPGFRTGKMVSVDSCSGAKSSTSSLLLDFSRISMESMH